MSYMNNTDEFSKIHEKSYRLVAAIFAVGNLIEDEDFKRNLRGLSLSLVPAAIGLKDINGKEAKTTILEMEKISLHLISMLDIAALSNMVSKMNRDVIKEELRSFVGLLSAYARGLEEEKTVSIQGFFLNPNTANIQDDEKAKDNAFPRKREQEAIRGEIGGEQVRIGINNGHKRKTQRKSAIMDFVKGHNGVDIKDISSNITGCSEKTIQRELVGLIKEGKITKKGERRWSKYYPL